MNLQQKLLQWFHKNQRPLPWRKHYRPYEVWISEIMLQQTQVETALPYFKRWIKQFPNIESLAESDERKVLKVWEGLGYYSRARNLHQSAKAVMDKYSGAFPENYEDILALQGIGEYTAGAIASIAFNQDKPIVDGNVLRVLSRVYAIDKPIDVSENKKIFWQLEENLIPKGRARFFNQALMELGALVCTKQNPSCKLCPIHDFCAAFKQDKVEDYPVRKNKKKMVRVEAAAVVLERNEKYFIHKRPVGKIMGGLWEFPEWKLEMTTGPAACGTLPVPRLSLRQAAGGRGLPSGVTHRHFQKLSSLAKKDLGLSIGKLEWVGKIKRNYTHHLETLHVFKTVLTGRASIRSNWPSAWITKKGFKKYPLSSAHAKIAAMI